jgi:site-specific DNA recombinase
VKRITVEGKNVKVNYKLPGRAELGMEPEVLPTETFGGAEGTRTPYLLVANEALFRLSYSPTLTK